MRTLTRRRVKICGITTAIDARLAASLGADAIGLNFHPASSRYIDPERVAEITENLPAFVTVVALFVNPARNAVEKLLDSGTVQCLQFHGDEPLSFCRSFGVPFIKALRVRDLEETRRQLDSFDGAGGVILDAYVKGEPGGTGQVFDWQIARQLVEEGHDQLILAGGLTPDNVAAAIGAVSPYGVDVSSGVESRPGIKDPDRMRRFFAAVSG